MGELVDQQGTSCHTRRIFISCELTFHSNEMFGLYSGCRSVDENGIIIEGNIFIQSVHSLFQRNVMS